MPGLASRQSLVRLCAVVALVSARDVATAATISTAHGNGMDSSVQEDYPTAAPGSGDELEVIRNPGAGSRAFLIRFDLIGWVPGSYYSDATTIELTNYRDQHDTHTVNVWGLADGSTGDTLAGLDEATVTWSSAPGLVPDALLGDDEDIHPSNIFLGSFADGSVDGAVDLFTTEALLDFLNGFPRQTHPAA